MNNIHDHAFDEYLFIIGYPPIQDFVRFVRSRSVDGWASDDVALTREWRRAHARVKELTVLEKDWVNVDKLDPLPAEMLSAANEAISDPAVERSLGFLPYEWAVVPLDRLILWQKSINATFARFLGNTFPASLSNHDLIRVATGREHESPPVRVTANTNSDFTFTSASHDLRVLGAVPLNPKDVRGYEAFGRAAVVIGIFVGYGVNLITAIYYRNRLILVNGTHRAYALRARGITHAPCIVHNICNDEDLELLPLPQSKQSFHWHASTLRPPVLKDYFDAGLTRNVVTPRNQRLLQLELNLRDSWVAGTP